MRRKSARNAQKATAAEKPVKEEQVTPKTRRSRRRKRSPSKSTDSEDEVLTVTKRAPLEETPDTTTKSHTPSDEEGVEEPIWKVTPTDDSPKGEIQKLKICLTRPSPDSPEKTKARRSKSRSQTEDDATSSDDRVRKTRARGSPLVRKDGCSSQEGDEDVECKKGKGKSKGKHKSKIDKSSHLNDAELETNNEISENVQVTHQSPSIDMRVDNENDSKVNDDVQNVKDTEQKPDLQEDSVSNDDQNSSKDCINEGVQPENVVETEKQDSDDEPLSIMQKNTAEIDTAQEIITEPVKQPEEIVQVKEDSQHSDTKPEAVIESEKIQETEELNSTEILSTQPVDNDKEVETTQSVMDNDKEIETTQSVDNDKEIETTQSVDNDKEIETTQPVDKNKEVEESIPEVETPNNNTASPEKEEVLPMEIQTTENEIEQKKSETIIEEKKPEEQPEKTIKEVRPRLKLNRNNSRLIENNDQSEVKSHGVKLKWEMNKDVPSSLFKVDLESIQTVCPSIDFPEEPDLTLEIEKERRKSVTESTGKTIERKVSVDYKSDSSDRPSYDKQSSVGSAMDTEDNSNIIAFNRKISIVDDTASKLRPPPSPAKNPVSNILFITNLVRPFTVKQLRELLERTGTIQGDGFWTDKIKSKCYVKYENLEEAEMTRNALHSVQWPIGNGKKLIIDYATEEDMQNAINPPAPPVVAPAETKTTSKENLEPVEDRQKQEERMIKEAEKKRMEGPVREWDIGKKEIRDNRSRSRERNRKHKRTPSPSEDFITRKQRKAEDYVPQKMMDDLFLKTKATPSIYWQPLSPEEIAMKQQQRLIRMEEHKRRMEENSRMRSRDVGRGGFRRRYD